MTTAISQSLEQRGICSVCTLVDSCERASDLKAPPMICEKFEPDPVLVSEMLHHLVTNRASVPSRSVSENHLGLCANCDHREHCNLRRGEGGVWHCEEYA